MDTEKLNETIATDSDSKVSASGDYTDFENYSDHSGYSEMFEALELMERVEEIETRAQEKGMKFDDEGFYQLLGAMDEFIDPALFQLTVHDDYCGFYEPYDSSEMWQCAHCDLLNFPNRLRCTACFSWSDLVQYALTGDTMTMLMSYLDETTLINLYFCRIGMEMDYGAISEMIHSRTLSMESCSAMEDGEIPDIDCVVNTDYPIPFEQWQQKIFDEWDIGFWGQNIEIKEESGWKRIGRSFHRNYIPVKIERMYSLLRWIFDPQIPLMRLDVLGVDVQRSESNEVMTDKPYKKDIEILMVRNNDPSKLFHFRQI